MDKSDINCLETVWYVSFEFLKLTYLLYSTDSFNCYLLVEE